MGALIGFLIIAIPLFLINAVVVVASLGLFSQVRRDPLMWVAWALFAAQAVFWGVVLSLNVRNAR